MQDEIRFIVEGLNRENNDINKLYANDTIVENSHKDNNITKNNHITKTDIEYCRWSAST